MRNFVLIFLFLYSISSWAALSEISISGYASPTGDNTTSMKIYTGRAGDTTNCSTEYSETPCNTCTAITTLCSGAVTCNEKSILPTTLLVVNFKTNSTTAINSAAAKISIGSGTNIANAYSQTDFTAASTTNNFANQTLTAAFKWSDICQLGAGDQSCESSIAGSSKSIRVGISDGTTMSAESFALEVNFKYIDPLAVPAYHKNCGNGGEDPNQYDGACGLALTPR
jgi:hypothetical protein